MQIQFAASLTQNSNRVIAAAGSDLSAVLPGSFFVPSLAPASGGDPYVIGVQTKTAPASSASGQWELLLVAPWAAASAAGVPSAVHQSYTSAGEPLLDFNDAGVVALLNQGAGVRSGLFSRISSEATAAAATAGQALSVVGGQDQSVARDLTVGRNLSVSGGINVTGGITTNSLALTGNFYASGIGLTGNFSAVGTGSFGNLVTFGSEIRVTGNITGTTLSLTGASSFTTISATGNAFVGGTLTSAGNASFGANPVPANQPGYRRVVARVLTDGTNGQVFADIPTGFSAITAKWRLRSATSDATLYLRLNDATTNTYDYTNTAVTGASASVTSSATNQPYAIVGTVNGGGDTLTAGQGELRLNHTDRTGGYAIFQGESCSWKPAGYLEQHRFAGFSSGVTNPMTRIRLGTTDGQNFAAGGELLVVVE